MPNLLSATGLTTATHQELLDKLSAAYRDIYGEDINLDPDSPDGQMMNIYIQMVLDLQDLIKEVYNSFDPDKVIGVVQDARNAINGIQRQQGTYTITPITAVASQATNLYGLDQIVEDVYTIQDDAGNNWLLENTQNIAGPGTYIYNFRAENPGAVLTIPNTINIPVSIVLGITSVNNPTGYTTLGIDEESNEDFRIRRQKSVQLASQGYLESLLAALYNVSGVTGAYVYENNLANTNEDGQPGHSIWVIVGGNAEDAYIANAIYTKRNGGCSMYGTDKSYTLTQKDGSPFVVRWDQVQTEDLYVRFTIDSIDGITAPDVNTIRNSIPALLKPGVNAKTNVNQIASVVQGLDKNAIITNIGLGLTPVGPFISVLAPSSKKNQFVISADKVIITPIQLKPDAISLITPGDSRLFQAFGGFGAYSWSLETNESGGSIDPVTGMYTAGPTYPATDVVRVDDENGNYQMANVGVA